MAGVHPAASASDVIGGVMGNILLGQTTGPGGDHALGTSGNYRLNVSATFAFPPPSLVISRTKCKKGKKLVKRKGKRRCVKKKKKKKKRKVE